MLNAIINIFIPIVVLLTLSSDDRLGPIPALLLAIGIPATYGIYGLLRTRKVNSQSLLGVISVLLTGVIVVFKLDTALFPIKEAVLPMGFALILMISNRTGFPIVKMLFDMVLRKDRVEEAIRDGDNAVAYRHHIERSGVMWAGIMALSGVMKFTLSSFIITAPAGTTQFNTQLATYELAQIPTSMMITMVLILSLIWYIGKGTARIVGSSPADVLRGGARLAGVVDKIRRSTHFGRKESQPASTLEM